MNKLKNNLYDIYIKNKKLVYITLTLIIILLIVLIAVNIPNNSNNNDNSNTTDYVDKIVLFGEKVIVLNKGDKYQEPGFYAVSKRGEIKTDLVVVSGNVNVNEVGIYVITYKIDDKVITRTIKVVDKVDNENTQDIKFNLKGDSLVVLEKGNKYQELGYIATYNGQDVSNSVIISGYVDTNKIGTYELIYKLKIANQEQTLTRKISVVDSNMNVSIVQTITNYTNQSIKLDINITGNSYSYIKFPNGTVSKEVKTSYTVGKNGSYDFYVYDNNSNFLKKTINITNIDKDNPVATCEAIIKDNITTIKVVASDALSGIKEYSYQEGGIVLNTSSSNTHVFSSKISSPIVSVYDKAGNKVQVSCNVINKTKTYDLEVHYINVGREDAILIRSSEKTIFIDGGSYNKKTIITSYLKNLGITHIDAIIGSHLHFNHIQAQAAILDNFSVDAIYYGQDLTTCLGKYCEERDQQYILDSIKRHNKKITIMKLNDNITIGDMKILCIGPTTLRTLSQTKYPQNYNSLNFILTYGNNKFMFTGDYMQSDNILKQFSQSTLKIDVLKYPHHGNSSIDKTLINYMSPKYVVVTNSRDELSGRSESTYLSNVGAKIYYSYRDKNILITSNGTNVSIKTNINPSDYKR